MLDLMNFPERIRNIALVGNIHHGKSALLDMLIKETHVIEGHTKELRYTDVSLLERDRGIGLKAMPMSLVMGNMKGKSLLLNFVDCPGHVDFLDEMQCALRVVDGAVLVVDAVEGVMQGTELSVRMAVKERIPLILVINKIDRLIMELKLPPTDAYFKLQHTIEELNAIIGGLGSDFKFSPELGNVMFASTKFEFCFTLKSMAKMYAESFGLMDVDEFAKRLWGDIYFNNYSKRFKKTPSDNLARRSFVEFVLEPIYKIFSHIVAEDEEALCGFMEKLGINLKKSDYSLDIKPMMKLVFQKYFAACSESFVDVISSHLPSPIDKIHDKIMLNLNGNMDSCIAKSISESNPDGPLVINIVKMYPNDDATKFDVFGRIMSGTVKRGKVKVLGEAYSADNEEYLAFAEITNIWLYQSRYKIEVDQLIAGNLVLLRGIDQSIVKTATVYSADYSGEMFPFKPLNFYSSPVVKVAIEPVNPSELPKMLDGLRKIGKSYPQLATKVEESGEHIVFGNGELQLDCALYDLRKLYAEIDVKVADPVVSFAETVVDLSSLKCFVETPNRKNKFTMIAEPLEKNLAADIQSGQISMNLPPKELSSLLQKKHGWDILASRSIWAFGGTNVLMDDSLETDKTLLYSIKDSVVQGFQWCVKEGPLCDEPIKNVKFKILDSSLATEPIYRGSGQIIPTTRRVCYSSFLTASPRLMEPVYSVEIQTTSDCLPNVFAVLGKRRGHVVSDTPKAGSPLYTVKAFIPVIESFGFETDLRCHTLGQAFCQQTLDHWQVVPGDPLDKRIVLKALEPSPAPHLARDFMLKTRRRKGLSEDVSVGKFFDDSMIIELAKQETLLR